MQATTPLERRTIVQATLFNPEIKLVLVSLRESCFV